MTSMHNLLKNSIKKKYYNLHEFNFITLNLKIKFNIIKVVTLNLDLVKA